MPNTRQLLASLRSISEQDAGGPALIDVGDAEKLSALGLIDCYGPRCYLITPRGMDVLRKVIEHHHYT